MDEDPSDRESERKSSALSSQTITVLVLFVITVTLAALAIWSASLQHPTGAGLTGTDVFTDVAGVSAAISAIAAVWALAVGRLRSRSDRYRDDEREMRRRAERAESAQRHWAVFNEVRSRMPKELKAGDVQAIADLAKALDLGGEGGETGPPAIESASETETREDPSRYA